MIGQMAIAIALIGFNDLGRSVTRPQVLRIRCTHIVNDHWTRVDKQTSYELRSKQNKQLNHEKLPQFSVIFQRLQMCVELMSGVNLCEDVLLPNSQRVFC